MTDDKLEDVHQKIVHIPFNSSEHPQEWPPEYYLYQDRDLPDGAVLRLLAYQKAWNKCLDRINSIIRQLRTPVVSEVAKRVTSAYSKFLPGLPGPELPAICIIDPSANNTSTREIIQHITSLEAVSEGNAPAAFITHLYPFTCSNLSSAMKALITGFIETPLSELVSSKRRATASLATHDITMLRAWYNAVLEAYESPRHMIVVLHEFEQFDPRIMHDVFYICSQHLRHLPLVFLLSMSSPFAASFLRQAYPRSTLAMLRVELFNMPHGFELLEEIMLNTFFSVDFDPDVQIGPSAFDYLLDHFTRYNSSTDAILTNLQLMHLKHFEEPLTALVHNTLVGTSGVSVAKEKLLQPQSFSFLDSILARLHNPSTDPSPDHANEWRYQNMDNLFDSVDSERASFQSAARNFRLWFNVLSAMRNFVIKQGLQSARPMALQSLTSLMSAVLHEDSGKDVEYLVSKIKKLSVPGLKALVDELETLFQETEEDACSRISGFMNTLPTQDDLSGIGQQVAENVGDWLSTCLIENLRSLDSCKLWDIWYTGMTPFPSELLNPSIRASLLSGLLEPWNYLEPDTENELPGFPLWQLPDTSILFRRYLDSGKMINVYDWFESFVLVLESQRQHKKGKSRADGEGEQGNADTDDEQWKLQIQARFIRALHELDYLGFIKHTGRKPDHVLRTVFDIGD